jgi:hypothetical protein
MHEQRMDNPQKSMKMIMMAHGGNENSISQCPSHPTNVHTIFHLFGMMQWGRSRFIVDL